MINNTENLSELLALYIDCIWADFDSPEFQADLLRLAELTKLSD